MGLESEEGAEAAARADEGGGEEADERGGAEPGGPVREGPEVEEGRNEVWEGGGGRSERGPPEAE